MESRASFLLPGFLMHLFPLSKLILWELLELAKEITSNYGTFIFVDLCCYRACNSRDFIKFKGAAEHKQLLRLILSIKHHHGVIRVQSWPVPCALLSITYCFVFFKKPKNWSTHESSVKLDISTEINILLFKTG